MLGILLLGLQGREPEAPQGAEQFLRVATLNLMGPNDHHLNNITKFLEEMDTGAVLLEEVRRQHTAFIENLGGL